MEKLTLKTRLLNESIRKQQSVIDDFNVRLNDLKEGERLSNDEELDGGHLAQKVHMDAEVLNLNNQLQFAADEMEVLQTLQSQSNKILTHVMPGAAVLTNKANFFVCASIEQLEVDGDTYLGLSIHSPLYKLMSGKRKGDKFKFNNITYAIKEIF